MSPFIRLPDGQRSAPGLERRILRGLPLLMITGALPLALSYLLPFAAPRLAAEAGMIQFVCAGVALALFFATLVLGFGCGIVILMKGPAYVRDPYRPPGSN